MNTFKNKCGTENRMKMAACDTIRILLNRNLGRTRVRPPLWRGKLQEKMLFCFKLGSPLKKY